MKITEAETSFTDLSLHPRLLMATDKLGFTRCTDVQCRTIPLVLQHQDLLVSAETGSGKTAAFVLPTLQRLLTTSRLHAGVRALILAPTRELARQLLKQAKQLSLFTRIEAGLITGGDDFKYQKALFRKNPEIIVATPGRLVEHLQHQSIDFDDLEILIVDEADRMLDMGLGEDVSAIVGCCNKKRQTLLFSATLNHQGIKGIADTILHNPQIITLSTIHDQHSNIDQQIILADNDLHKQQLLIWLLANQPYQKALVFTNTKIRADQLRGPLRGQKLRVAVLHGDIDQTGRNYVMQQFHQGAFKVLIATDVAARGLDIQGVNLIVNFDMPRNATDYVHRIGRTGRAGEQGLAISLIKASEWNLMSAIERYLGQRFERRLITVLEGKYKGPKKVKSSGKAAGTKKKKEDKRSAATNSKLRDRNKKNIGNRRVPSQNQAQSIQQGGKSLIKKRSRLQNEDDAD